MAKPKAKKITRSKPKEGKAKVIQQQKVIEQQNEIKALKLQLAAAEEKMSGEEGSEQSEEDKRKTEELAKEIASRDKELQELMQDSQMELDDEDGGNGAGSEDVGERFVESIEPDGEREALFVPEPQDADPQGVKQTPVKQEYMGSEPAIKSKLWDPVYGEPLYVAASTQPNYNTPYRATVAWADDQKEVINCYGPRNASVHRIIRGGVEGDYAFPPEEKYTNPNFRLGEVRRPDGKFLYTKIDCLRVVAWKSEYPEDPREDLNLIHWNEAMRPVKRFPSTYILVDWSTANGPKRCWETRATVRNRWGTKRADKSIFEAAREAEKRLEEHLTGTRPAEDRSPTPGILYPVSRQFREISGTPAPTGTPTRTPAPAVGAANMTTLNAILEEFKKLYCELSGVTSFNELDAASRVEWIDAWKIEKARHTAIAV